MVYKRTYRKPHYIRVAEELRDGINSKQWMPGDLLPSETELCKRFSVSRGTAVKAIEILLRDGLAQRKQGVGTFVLRPALHRMPGYLLGFSETVNRQGMKPTHRLVEMRELARKDALQYGCEEAAILLKRVRLVDDVPWAIHTSLVPLSIIQTAPDIFGDASRVRDADFSLYKAFEDEGLVITHADEAINARLAMEEEVELLDIELPSAVMLVHRWSFDKEDRLIELSEAVYLGECYTYDTRLVRTQGVSTIDNHRPSRGDTWQ